MTLNLHNRVMIAEAQVGRLRAELAAAQAAWLVEVNKVARVREHCDQLDYDTDADSVVRLIRAALEGNQP